MYEKKALVAWIVIASLAVTVGLWYQFGSPFSSYRPLSTTLTIYSGDAIIRYMQDSPRFSTNLQMAERIFTSIKTGLYEPLATSDLSSSGIVVEVRYPTPVQLPLGSSDAQEYRVTIDRMMLSLTGPHTGLVLFGNGKYGNTPFVFADTTTQASLLKSITTP